MKDYLYLFLQYVKDRLKVFSVILGILFIFIIMFVLYSIAMAPIIDALVIIGWFGFIGIIIDFINYRRRHQDLVLLQRQLQYGLSRFPSPMNLIEQDYQQSLQLLHEQRLKVASQFDQAKTEMMDYYTLWAHQVKTPIAAMRLLLQGESGEDRSELLNQLFKIEQYVEMVLGYLRIENTSSDLVLEPCQLDHVVKQAIRKYASQFIRCNIKLELSEVNDIVVSDEKWLVFVIEQLLSNALKYTKSGSIFIYTQQDTLIIEDTGIGIAEEDLPRIFEKGFTGYNGRMDKKATGIGLYLCQKILNKLSHEILITSTIGVGTKVRIKFK